MSKIKKSDKITFIIMIKYKRPVFGHRFRRKPRTNIFFRIIRKIFRIDYLSIFRRIGGFFTNRHIPRPQLPGIKIPIYILSAFIITILLFSFLPNPIKKKKPEFITKKITLNRGDTLAEALYETGISYEQNLIIINQLKKVFNPRRCKPGDSFEVILDTSNYCLSFEYYTPGRDYYSVQKDDSGKYIAQKHKRTVKEVFHKNKGAIETSLWESMITQDIPAELILDFADIFAWEIDFLTEPRRDDIYKIYWKELVLDNGKRYSMQILAAQYNTKQKQHLAVSFTDPKGNQHYYNPKGKSMRKQFLKAPLQFRRISSYFSRRRFHPILKYYRPHLGIDYAAPRGTPVSSVGDGKVIFKGRKGGYGKLLKIRHSNGYITYYGHLHGFARKIRKGSYVRQGQVIGYVGSTGLSTGPHLDFRIKRNGKFFNFLRLKFPPAHGVHKKYMKEFKEVSKKLLAELANTNPKTTTDAKNRD